MKFIKQLHCWKETLSGYQPLEIPTDFVRPNAMDYNSDYQEFKISKKISQMIRALAQNHGVTLQSVILSSINILLSKYSGQSDIIIGSAIVNQCQFQTGDSNVFFVNKQVFRTLLNESQSYANLIHQVHQEQTEAQLHRDLPFEKLIDELNIEDDAFRHPIFQVMFVLRSFSDQNKTSDYQKNYSKFDSEEDAYESIKMDLSIFINDSGEHFTGQVRYATSLFRKDTIARLTDYYILLLDKLNKAPDQPYSQLNLLSDKEYKKIIYEWNTTDKEYPKDKTIYQLFEEQVKKIPDNIALVYGEQQLTYKELNEKSNQLARQIRVTYKQRTGKILVADTLIALCVDRSLEMLVGILAILKAGGAYVPIDPTYPQERIAYILEDTKAELVLSQQHLNKSSNAKLPKDNVIYIELTEELYTKQAKLNLLQRSKPKDLAYIIYTSGTTGKPKGVMVEHKTFLQFIYNFNDYLFGKLNSSQRNVLSLTNYVFDIFGLEYALPLITGNKVTLSSVNNIKEESISDNQIIQQTPSNLLHLANHYSEKFSTLTCLVGGEALSPSIAGKLMNTFHRVLNVYGPAETVIWSTAYEITDPNKPYIGTPLFNEHLYILDPNKVPVPIGVIGELYIAGAGLARGYLNRSDLTAERFIANPFATEADKAKGYNRLYKTGDLVRWLSDSNIEYIGRNDDQVKIRGYRIELGEIESVLSRIEGIKQACVLAKEKKNGTGNNKYLVAYYVMDKTHDALSQTTIHDTLAQLLPEYMVPNAFVQLEIFPLTNNGKLDKRALPDPDFTSSPDEYIAATTELEKEVCEIWKDVLGIARVGVTDNFFRIGGNSILAIQVSHQMSKALTGDVKVADVFKYKNIAELLVHCKDTIRIRIPRVHTDHAALSFAQERLWFIEQYQEGTNAYHLPAVYELDVDTDIEGVKHALTQVVSRHEVLRSTIEQVDDQAQGIQRVHKDPLSIEEIRLTSGEDYKSLIKEDINRPFNLSKEYPIRVKLYVIQSDGTASGYREQKTLLLINTHHIASDGWSADVFQKELFSYYEAYIHNDTDFKLPELEIQYKDYALWERTYLSGDILSKQLSYWKEKLSGYQTLALATNYPRPNKIDYKGAYQRFTLARETSVKLRTLAKHYGVTLYSVMLSSITILLSKYTGQQDIVVGSPVANRHHSQTAGLIGFFVNMLINRTLLHQSQNFEDLIKQVHQEQIEAQLHQDLPFEKLVEELGIERDTSRHPVFQVMFVVESFNNQNKSSAEQKKYLRRYETGSTYEVEKFDLSVFINDDQQELSGQISYATSLFHKDTIARLIDHYLYMLDQLMQAPAKPYSQISLLDSKEYERIIYEWNATDNKYPKEKTIHQLFEEQVKKTPDNIALVYEQEQLTYKELNEKSNQLARCIRDHYKKRTGQELIADTLIALCLDRSMEMVIGILAVMKAGGAYVPMDPTYPQERLDYLLEDTKAEIILSHRHLFEDNKIRLPQNKVIYVEPTEDFYRKEAKSDLSQHSKSTDLAYVIYTSGTTGKPKGVMLEHFSLCNRIVHIISYSNVNSADHHLFKTNYVFDASFFEIFTHLCVGAKLQITKYLFELNELNKLILSNVFTSLHLVPSQYELVSSFINTMDLRKIYFSGEALTSKIVSSVNKNIRIYNYYGPTETGEITVSNPASPASVSVIGKVFPNCRLYVLDPNKNPMPIGVIGELYISGAGLARGYLNRNDLTEERFISNSFAAETDTAKDYTRLYKTGDLVRWLPDGNLEYIGRNDDQVKIRGHRIELAEIEHALLQVNGIKQGCVLARESKIDSGSINYLVAYYILDDRDQSLTSTSIQNELSQVLPDYMVPTAFVAMESFPLTTNGKLNKQALPEPDFSLSRDEYVAPTNETEAAFCLIWQEVLGLDRVGINDDFFKVGGNSILAIQVSYQMSRASACDIKVADVFKYPTCHKLVLHNTSKNIAYVRGEL